MSLLFDASAFLNMVRIYGREARRTLKGNLVLSFTKYEVGNALWKEVTLLKRISVEEALEAISLLDKVLKLMIVVDPSNSSAVFRLAHNLQVTYYDASYILAAIERGAKMVTDDVKLIGKIQENINIINGILGRKPEILSSDKIQHTP